MTGYLTRFFPHPIFPLGIVELLTVDEVGVPDFPLALGTVSKIMLHFTVPGVAKEPQSKKIVKSGLLGK